MVKNNLISFMAMNPASYGEPSAIPAFGIFGRALRSLRPVVAAGTIMVLLGGTASYAAEGALPGDLLYPVKVNVNEGVQVWLANSDEAKARLGASLAEKRLEEAEDLAAQGRLNAEVRAEIESRFEAHVKNFDENTKKIEARDDTKASAEFYSDFEASLKAHERILAQLGREKDETKREVEPIRFKVNSLAGVVAKLRIDVEAKTSQGTSASLEVAAYGKMKAAENKIEEVRSFILRVKPLLKASVAAEAEAKLEVASKTVIRGRTQVEAKTYNEAFASFQEAIRIAQEAKLIVGASERLNINITVPGVNIHESDNNSVDDNSGVHNGSDTNENSGGSEAEDGTEAAATIKTSVGDINLNYKDGNLTLSSTLFRSVPCINWKVQTTITKDMPPSNVTFDITKESTAELCIQVLGQPQTISATTLAAKDANITVKLEGKVVFEGKLNK